LSVATRIAQEGSAAEAAWNLILAAAALADRLDREGRPVAFTTDQASRLQPADPDGADGVLAWRPGAGWHVLLPPDDARAGLLSLYLPICSASARRPMTIAHLGQSLDGFIATHSGDSRFVTGDDNMVHMHRLRALCDAVVVGAGTVAADDPQLTTRLVPGPSPLRVVLDPNRRLTPSARVFVDRSAQTLYCCDRSRILDHETHVGAAAIVGLDGHADRPRAAELLDVLRARGCVRVFVEGGGVTVSAFLAANLLDRLQIAISPVLIGSGRAAIRLAPTERLSDCRRPVCRVFRMGDDVLFDCALDVEARPPTTPGTGTVFRVI
jgi:riboflavin-specific deaminase-like protein